VHVDEHLGPVVLATARLQVGVGVDPEKRVRIRGLGGLRRRIDLERQAPLIERDVDGGDVRSGPVVADVVGKALGRSGACLRQQRKECGDYQGFLSVQPPKLRSPPADPEDPNGSNPLQGSARPRRKR
jgi:hypothetical protein